MSKKTDNVKKAISNLETIQQQLENISRRIDERELDNLQFEMNQNLKNLKLWFASLYKYNGQSTSNAKKKSSRENGKKGGRPPKEITLARKRILELENEVIPQVEHQLKIGDEVLSEEQIKNQLDEFQSELENLKLKISAWELQKNK